jgi:7-cyano-7-deazaguanine synthase
VLLSGGLDSATCLAIAVRQGFEAHALSFDYGQRHAVELAAARRVARQLGAATHRVLTIDLRSVGGSALTADVPVPRDRLPGAPGIPVTYVPARNPLFLSAALGLAEVLGTGDVFIGVNAVDYSGYPDCRPEFIAAFEAMGNRALAAAVEGRLRVKIHAPLIRMSKAAIIRKGRALGVDFALTHSCYDPDRRGRPCGACESCRLRRAGFAAAGVPDPAPYRGASGGRPASRASVDARSRSRRDPAASP